MEQLVGKLLRGEKHRAELPQQERHRTELLQRPFGLERNEDQPEEMVEDEKGLYKKAKCREELRIRMDPLRGSVSDRERPDVSGPIRSIKMYSYAPCTMQEGSVCCRDVPCLAHMELGSGPLHLSTYHPPYLPGAMGTQSTGSLQEGWTWTVEWRFAASPTQILRSRIM
jgi:hypothetical protein